MLSASRVPACNCESGLLREDRLLSSEQDKFGEWQYTFGTSGNARIVSKEEYAKVDPRNFDFMVDTGEDLLRLPIETGE